MRILDIFNRTAADAYDCNRELDECLHFQKMYILYFVHIYLRIFYWVPRGDGRKSGLMGWN